MPQYVTFRLNDRLFGLNVLLVREINRLLDITPVQHATPCISGLINLRGQIVTIINLRERLGMNAISITEDTHNIILKTDSDISVLVNRGEKLETPGTHDIVGLMVDAIGDIVETEDYETDPPPANIPESLIRYVDGVLQTETDLLLLLDIQNVLKM